MKVLSKVILVLIIVVPIIVCVTTLQKVWDEEEDYEQTNGDTENNSVVSGEQIIIIDNEDNSNESNKVSGEMAGEQYVSTIGSPISKIYTDASVAITVANVYEEANENSTIVGSMEKYTVITAQKYPQGWSRVTSGSLSGWMRTENISYTDVGNLDVDTAERIGKIKADPYLNVRASTSSSATIITTIPNGTEVVIKDEVSGWYKVTYASATGWVSSAYVTLNP